MSWFAARFAEVPAPRTGDAKRHDLLEVLTIALTASVCGAEHCSDFADFAADREDLFREFLRLENGIPSHDTFSRVFRLLDPQAFARCFAAFVDALGSAGEGVVAIDGKTLPNPAARIRSLSAQPRRNGRILAFKCQATRSVNQWAARKQSTGPRTPKPA